MVGSVVSLSAINGYYSVLGGSVVSLSATNVYYSVLGVLCHMLCRVYFIWLSHCLLWKFDFC